MNKVMMVAAALVCAGSVDWVSLVGTIAYTGVLNGSARQSLGDRGIGWQGSSYRRDLLWGGVSLKFAF